MTQNSATEHPPFTLPVTKCKGVGPRTELILRNIGIATIGDLLYHFPRAYLDRRDIEPIASAQPAQQAVIKGEVTSIRLSRPSRRMNITQCVVKDGTGSLKVVWFNQPYMRRSLPRGTKVILSGAVSDRRGIQMENPDVEILSDGEEVSLHTMRLVPVYPLTEGISQKQMRRLVHAALKEFSTFAPENLPKSIIEGMRLVSRRDALRGIHFPEATDEIKASRRRIAAEEFISLQLCMQASMCYSTGTGIAQNSLPRLTAVFESRLPFRLTDAQKRAIAEIFRRMESPTQMNVLLQGDVGSGKTVVAACAMLKSVENGRQAVLMAPTEILAEQHISSLRGMFGGTGVPLALLSGSRPASEKKATLELLASLRPCIVVGTHALLRDKVGLPNLGLVVIDEQHRFGVSQRAALHQKSIAPDLIVMTATPIPRTLALALYGSFASIVLDECPSGRRPVVTRYVHESERARMYKFIRESVDCGRQAFVVCPEIGEECDSGARDIAGVSGMFTLYMKVFPQFSVGVLHGRMQPEERERTLSRFRAGEIQILVATTIIEVGVDVPNAAVMVIEDADRFGLAQLHQVRGRVGRGQHESYCFLMGEPSTEQAAKRLEIMTSINDGFQIAEHDLLLRGPGEFLGVAQSGSPKLRVGHLARDIDLLQEARKIALAVLGSDPRLERLENGPIRLLIGKDQPGPVHL
ncbi:ATP-dependent DNA helicase RecG [Candidatus Poribacteria bacterium]|nr:ATP-dependent DNA helicase RecG [Candidatus Poribacteria bacterium]